MNSLRVSVSKVIPIDTTCTVTQRKFFDITKKAVERIRSCYVLPETTEGSPTDSGDNEALVFLLLAYLRILFQDSAVCTN